MNPIQASKKSNFFLHEGGRAAPVISATGVAVPSAQPSTAFLPDDEEGYYAAPEEEAEEEPEDRLGHLAIGLACVCFALWSDQVLN